MTYLTTLFDHFDADHPFWQQPMVWSSIASAKDRNNPVPDTRGADHAACGQVFLTRTSDGEWLEGWATMIFSDRGSGTETGPRDRWRIEISRDQEVRITLIDWVPNSPFTLTDVSFFDGSRGGQFMTGFLNEGNGASVISMSFDRGVRTRIR